MQVISATCFSYFGEQVTSADYCNILGIRVTSADQFVEYYRASSIYIPCNGMLGLNFPGNLHRLEISRDQSQFSLKMAITWLEGVGMYETN